MRQLQTFWDTLQFLYQWLCLEINHSPNHRTSLSSNTRHLALFAWALPPNSNAGVYRPLSFIRFGSSLGWRIDAFQGEVPVNQSEHGDELLASVPGTAKLHVVPPLALHPSYKLTPQVDGDFKNSVSYAAYAIKLLAGDPPSLVFASGPPFHVFVAGLFVAKWFGVPLVLDYRDEWTECPFDFVSAGKQDRFWERRCLKAADAVLFTTASHLKHQLEKFSELSADKAYLVPNGWEPDDFSAVDTKSLNSKKPVQQIFNLAHVGNLAGHNPPHDFLNALAELFTKEPVWQKRLNITFIGRRSADANSAIENFPFKENIFLVDHVGKKEANYRMQTADALLLLTAPELERYLPGKLFDYIGAGRPVLAYGSSGESSEILAKLKTGLFCPSGSAELLGQSLQTLSDSPFVTEQDLIKDWLDNHRRDKLAEKAFGIFSSLTDK